MVEILIWSLMVGSLGLEAALAGVLVSREQLAAGQKCDEEEEVLTRYESQEDNFTAPDNSRSNGIPQSDSNLADLTVWEYKIVRASSDLFGNPAIFHKLCREEAEVGWILLEKLDDRRVRFKRPIALRDAPRPNLPPFDPYRTHYGPMSNAMTWAVAIVFLSAIVLPAVLGYALVSATLTRSRSNWPPAPVQSLPSPGGPETNN
ncbi:hypothetical protein QT972_25130 [Microcoleus sp. herbarium7]|uniref:hypothetical protein n=1 Tax=Microcoleus sp. herbarium7 TaxID=3055435 RepID=UPI002FD18A1D